MTHGRGKAGCLALTSVGLAFCWPLLRRTYSGLLLAGFGDSLFYYLVFACMQFLALGVVYWALRARRFNPSARRPLAFVTAGGFLLSLTAFFSGTFASGYGLALGLLGLAGFVFAVPLLIFLWVDTLIRMDTGAALTALSVSFALSFALSLFSLLGDTVREIVLAALPVISSILLLAINNRQDCVFCQSNQGGGVSCPRELIGLLGLFILVGGMLRGLASPTGVVFSPESDISGILFRNIVSLAIAIALAFGSHVLRYSLRANILGMLVSCVLFLVGMLMSALHSDDLANQGLNLVAMARNCLEFLLMVTLATGVRTHQAATHREGTYSGAAVSILVRFLLPIYAAQLMSYAIVPFLLRLPMFSGGQGSWIFSLVSALLLVAGMLIAVGFMLFRYAHLVDENTSGITGPMVGEMLLARCTTSSDGVRRSSLDKLSGTLGLSGREAEIAALLSQGHSYKRVAEILGISVSTVQSHTRNLYRKCGVTSRQGLIDLLDGTSQNDASR